MKTIVVVGDLNVDIVLAGMPCPPAFGKEILASDHVIKAGGSAANVAFVLAAHGCAVKLFSRVGNDREGQYLLSEVREHGLGTGTISCSREERTGITVSLSYPHDRMYVSRLGTVATTTLAALPEGCVSAGDHLHLASYFLQQALQRDVGRLLAAAKEAGMSTSLDPGGDPSGEWELSELTPHLPHLDWFMPSEDEIKAITRSEDTQEAIRRFSPDVAGLVVKTGAGGAVTRYEDKVQHHAGRAVEAIDTTCAGDCFDAGFLHVLSAGGTLAEAVDAGNRYGAEAVACLGLPL